MDYYRDGDFNDPTMNITCNITRAAGEPQFEIIFHGDERHRFWILHENRVIENNSYYYNGAYMTSVKLPPKGLITCRVNDSRGSYNSSFRVSGKHRTVVLWCGYFIIKLLQLFRFD